MASLESFIDFSIAEPLFANEQQRTQAVSRFCRIVEYFEAAEKRASPSSYDDGYNRPALIRLTFQYARSPESQDRLLGAFFRSLALGMLEDSDGIDLGRDSVVAGFRPLVFGFADFLMANFFLPVRAAMNKTPQPSPVYHAAIQQAHSREEQQRIQNYVGTPEPLSVLRGTCLTRDRHRCVITRTFNSKEMSVRSRQPPAKDDDGNILGTSDQYGDLDVAHILPYALTKGVDSELDESRKPAISILNMFDIGVIHLIEGPDIDRPRNALTLSLEMHRRFGHFDIFFEPVMNAPPHTYEIKTFLPWLSNFPITRTLFMHPLIEPPSERLLALHSAIGHILHLSGAGGYIDRIIDDLENGVVQEDGSTQLDVIMGLALRIKVWSAGTYPPTEPRWAAHRPEKKRGDVQTQDPFIRQTPPIPCPWVTESEANKAGGR